MKIVIEISEEDYKLIKSYGKCSTNYRISLNLYDAVRDGTPLPKHHGRLIDESKITKWCYMPTNQLDAGGIRTDAPTIIEGSESE